VVVLKLPAMGENAGRYMSMAKGLTTLSSPKRKMIHARLWRRDVMVDLSSVISASQLCDVLVSGVGESFVDWSGSFGQRLQPSFSTAELRLVLDFAWARDLISRVGRSTCPFEMRNEKFSLE